MSEDYFSSDKCTSLISNTLNNISENKLKVYIHLLEFKKVLKTTQKMKRKSLKVTNEVEAKKSKLVWNNIETRPYVAEKALYHQEIINDNLSKETIVINNDPITVDDDNLSIEKSPIIVNDKIRIDKYIVKLEKVLQSTKDQIEKLEEQELTLDDLGSEMSPFVMLDKLKAHYVKVWKKVSKLRSTKCNLRKRYLKSFEFSGSIYPELNKDIEKFVKMKKFPDYHDIRNLVAAHVMKHSLNLSSQKISEITIDIFTQIGNKLKKLRIAEFVQHFGNHLTDQVRPEDDPVIHDAPLRRVLHRNHVEAENNMDMVMESFVKLQQANIVSSVDNVSDISTEHSVNSEDEEVDENMEESFLKTSIDFENQLNESNILSPEAHINSMEDRHSDFSLADENPLENGMNYACGNEPITTVSCISASMIDHVTADIPNGILIPFNPVVAVPVTLVVEDKPTEEYIAEISSTTFQFNVDQMKHGASSKYYSEIIVLNSDDDDSNNESDNSADCNSSEDVIDVDNSHFAFSSKLDDFFISNLRPRRRPEIKEIVINLEDDDDDDVQEIMMVAPQGDQGRGSDK